MKTKLQQPKTQETIQPKAEKQAMVSDIISVYKDRIKANYSADLPIQRVLTGNNEDYADNYDEESYNEGDYDEESYNEGDYNDEYDDLVDRIEAQLYKKNKRGKKHIGGAERYDFIKHMGRKGKVPRKAGEIDIHAVGNAEAMRLRRNEKRDLKNMTHTPPIVDNHGQGILNDHIRLAPSVISVAHTKDRAGRNTIGIGKSKDRIAESLHISNEHQRGIDRVAKSRVNEQVNENWDTIRCGEHEALSSLNRNIINRHTGVMKGRDARLKDVKMTAVRTGKLAFTPPCSRCGEVFSGAEVSPARVEDLSDYRREVNLAESVSVKNRVKGKIKRKNRIHKPEASTKQRHRILETLGFEEGLID